MVTMILLTYHPINIKVIILFKFIMMICVVLNLLLMVKYWLFRIIGKYINRLLTWLVLNLDLVMVTV